MSRKSEIMSKEILFRGKTDGQWVQGSYVCGHKRYGTGEAVHFITDFYGNNRVVVIPETLGQFTGLTDRKGKRIFEQDIVRYLDRDKLEWKGEVVYLKENASYLLKIDTRMGSFFVEFIHIDIKQQLEVIGNKWDNGLEGI